MDANIKQGIADQVKAVTFNDDGETKEERALKVEKSKWLQALEKEKLVKIEREKADRQARAERLANLFEEEEVALNSARDNEDLLDFGAADHNQANFLNKIDAHLQMEKKILEAWHDNDEAAKAKE